ncbi:sodium-coupled monocarboxylate transporter 2-like isoform X1 [Dermacentor andersoni]|uniref:sodium-coupled monocarboxylate transporter 2-like isoform X1 n=1 Tax=Dermacentor andersoni TaxID=34620 RepID=UPI0024164006|nr:sodium-coupled monocarboxylate transporter 2-like isoform X1 [Dermacentor andersoni]
MLLLVLMYSLCLTMGVSLTVWFRGCDPGLLGVIKSIDQILPYYINTYLVHIPGFLGLFLAGVVCAATSTISSTINSQATIIYVDVISPHCKNADQHVLWITRCTVLILGVIMTVYSTLCVYMGSLTRLFIMVYASITAPFVGLCLLAALFPFVHSKGAGVATSVTAAFQLWHMTQVIRIGKTPPRMPVSLDYCPGNHTSDTTSSNTSPVLESNESVAPFFLLRLSPMWSSLFAILATIFIGVLVSAITGEIKKNQAQSSLCSDALVRFWRKLSKPTEESKIVVRRSSSSCFSRQCQVTLTSSEGAAQCVPEAENLLVLKEDSQV